jgi:pimeloyl-ACP methyl ester carboxylesterase
MNHLTTSHIIVLCLLASLHAQLYPYPGSAEMENAKAGDLVLKPGQLKEYAADFGTLVVPESRGKKDSRLIRLPVLRMRSRREHPLEPVFTLEGGPGGTNIKPDYIRDWLLENHDVVMVGYRGVDGSVSLNCPEVSAALKTMADPLSQAGLKDLGAVMTRAAQRLQDEGIDLPEYDIINVVDDLEAARKALGYSRINLSGASYGGAVAYTYCIRYPQSLHRNLMGEPAFPWDIGVTEPKDIDKNLARLNTLWKQNPDCLKRSKDIVQTIRSVLKALPQSWQQIRIDPGRVKLCTFLALYNRNTTNQALDAFVAAENGDYSGLAFMAVYWGQIVDWFNWGDLVAKTYCTQTVRTRDYEAEMDPPGSIIGAPLSKLGWGALKYCDWPRKPLPLAYRTPQETDVETLLVWAVRGDETEPARKEARHFKRGQVVLLKDLGHMDVGSLQPQAAHHLEKRFFLEGVADASLYQSITEQARDFVPRPSFQELAKQMLSPK